MKCSEITLLDAIRYVNEFCPVKIIFNDIVLYNDYDSDVVIELADDNKIYGELAPPLAVIPDRTKEFCNSTVITSINIEVVDYHHSIVTLQGNLKFDK